MRVPARATSGVWGSALLDDIEASRASSMPSMSGQFQLEQPSSPPTVALLFEGLEALARGRVDEAEAANRHASPALP